MIDKDNFKELLHLLDFAESDNGVFYKDFADIDATLKVDFKSQQLIYPEDKGLIVNERQTCNFSQKENFVVFECVHRLLEKKYKPNHIELEPRWQVGHGASGGRADIMVKDNSGKSLLIIECKTAGREYDDAWKRTLINGGQLLSYSKQAGSTQFVCLYSSDIIDGKLKFSNYVIVLKDNLKLLEELSEKDPLSYEKAKLLDKEDIYTCWKETYAQDFATKGIFEEDIPSYKIGKTKYTINDLATISSNDIQGKYHQFATILRQHNVSGRENAFDKLVNLFLCKIVDETNNPEELRFYWKGIAYDSYFDLVDRLQRLYQVGMDRFLGEDVVYISTTQIDEAFKFFKKDPDSTKETIKRLFKELKFYNNNDFGFIDVHNEKLFYQNSAVLLKIVQMLQDIRLKTENQNQFLGDMFEGFLDQGVKQSEGQFFTPMPIVKFILKSLPLEHVVNSADQIPRMIDFACGAGHFLTEYANELKPIIEKRKDKEPSKYFSNIIGIEKEYRLSKVSKVSAFMYGQDDIKIVYADALAINTEIKDNDYSVLVANPPYSVKGFLETLSDEDLLRYQLIDTIEQKSYPNNNSIETFFIERAKQLLKPDGIAGIIVPPSILSRGKAKSTSKSKNIYVAAREILLKYFDIIAIAEFGSGTFGKTGTSTVTLFLRRRKENPAPADHYLNRVNSWFKGDKKKDNIFKDQYFIEQYCDRIGVEFSDYITFINGEPNKSLLNGDLFRSYSVEFEKWAEVKNKRKMRSFKALSKKQQEKELNKMFYDYVKSVEKEKLYYFILASLNPQKVLVVRSPSKNIDMKDFLGYEWSSAKGKEGIKYLGGISYEDVQIPSEEQDEEIVDLEEDDKRVLSNIFNLNNISTPLYDPNNRYNEKKVNYLIERNFRNESFEIPSELSKFVSKLELTEMIDFMNVDFNKAINLVQKNKIIIDTKWKLERLGDITEIKNGGTPDTNNPAYWNNGTICWATLVDTKHKYLTNTKKKITQLGLKNSNALILPINTVIFSSRATIGEVTINKVPTCTNQGYKNFVCDPKKVDFEYLYYILVHYKKEIESIIPPGTKYKEINTTDIRNFKIPLPPLPDQKILVSKLLKFEKEKNKLLANNMSVEEYEKLVKDKTEDIINNFIK
ncbi:MAG: restriction endonuclease subunit S [Bacteroidetes bacterium]|nr:restriction endonuclease subunit S [Bacteroidota bacterium]